MRSLELLMGERLLSPRQRQVVTLLAEGLTNKEIAARMQYESQSDRPALRVGARYALFLRTLPEDPPTYVLAFEPSQFEIGTLAMVRSSWPDARKYFPGRPAAEFVEAVRNAAEAGR